MRKSAYVRMFELAERIGYAYNQVFEHGWKEYHRVSMLHSTLLNLRKTKWAYEAGDGTLVGNLLYELMAAKDARRTKNMEHLKYAYFNMLSELEYQMDVERYGQEIADNLHQ